MPLSDSHFFKKGVFMKRLIFLITILGAILLLLVSCAEEPQTPETPENADAENAYDPLTNTTEEESVACYYSLKTEDGFENYILAFPTEWRKGYQALLEYDDETFDIAIANATETVHSLRDEEYEYSEFHIEYEFVSEREITGDEYNTLTKELSDYCYMTLSTIEAMKAQTYSVHTYGVAADGTLIKDETVNEELYMVFIKDDGWYVSPHCFDLP